MRTAATVVACFTALVCAAGCLPLLAGAGAGVGGTAYARGDLEARVNADPRAVATATEQAMKALDIAVISSQASGVDAEILGRTARDKKVKVVVEGSGTTGSELSIRVGVFGDEEISRRLFTEIQKRLPANE